MTNCPAVGDVVTLGEPGAWGTVTDIIDDDDGNPAAIVVCERPDRWHAIQLRDLDRRKHN